MKQYLYIKVIEAKDITPDGENEESLEPFVTGKINGHEHLHKKSTKHHSGIQWWEHIFRFTIKDFHCDWVVLEVRQKGLHVFSSDWLGEVVLHARDYKDNQVHENWFRLGKGLWKSHTRAPRGYLHLMIQMIQLKSERPFIDYPAEGTLTFSEWESKGMPNTESTTATNTVELEGDLDKNAFLSNSGTTSALMNSSGSNNSSQQHVSFELLYNNIYEAEHAISKNAWKILMHENPTTPDILEMKKLNRVNCLHKGHFDDCKGKRYMVMLDGSHSSDHAFTSVLSLIDREKDHLFIVTIRERKLPNEFFNDDSRIILTHKLWRAAAGIISQYQDRLEGTGIDYTSILPAADDAREMTCALVRKFKVDVLVIGKHTSDEKRHHSVFFRSFQRYCQAKANCSVLTIE